MPKSCFVTSASSLQAQGEWQNPGLQLPNIHCPQARVVFQLCSLDMLDLRKRLQGFHNKDLNCLGNSCIHFICFCFSLIVVPDKILLLVVIIFLKKRSQTTHIIEIHSQCCKTEKFWAGRGHSHEMQMKGNEGGQQQHSVMERAPRRKAWQWFRYDPTNEMKDLLLDLNNEIWPLGTPFASSIQWENWERWPSLVQLLPIRYWILSRIKTHRYLFISCMQLAILDS